MTLKLHCPEKKQLGALLIIFRVGTFIGFLPIKHNPLKSDAKDGPFVPSWVLLTYSCLLWLMCTLVTVRNSRILYIQKPEVVFLLLIFVFNIQMYFIFWIVIARKSVPQILNKLSRLIHGNPKLQISFIEWFTPYFPIVIVFPVRTVLSFNYMVRMPFLTFLDVFQSFGMVFTNGLIYTWIMYSEKLYFNMDYHIRLRSRRLSVNTLKLLMAQYLDIEAFLYSISKTCGIPYLTMSVVTVSVGIMYSNNAMNSVVLDSHETGLQYFQNLLNFVNWNYSLYIMACVCYRSHQLSIQVKRLKWSLDEVQTKRNLDFKILQMVYLFEKRINEKNIYFSAFGSINFDVSLIIMVLNKIITYLFAISPLRQP